MAGKLIQQIKRGGYLSVIAITSFLLSVGTIMYLLRHTIKFQQWGTSDWLMFWQLLVILITAVIALITIFIGKRTSKQRATLDVILNYYQDDRLVTSLELIIKYIRGTAVDDHGIPISLYDIYQDKDKSWDKEKACLMTLINRHEFYACAINTGVLDETLFKRVHCTNFIKLWNAVSPLVMKIREEERKDTLFIDLEILVSRWKANPLKAEDL